MEAAGSGTGMAAHSAIELYDTALFAADASPPASYWVIGSDGTRRELPLRRWLGAPPPEEEEILERAVGPVLDVGCGAGRHLAWLRSRRIACLGADIAPGAVALARRHGAPVLDCSIFERLPLAGRWATALLLDGNIGIGGDPLALLRRVRSLLRPSGSVFVELEPPGWLSRELQIKIEGPAASSEWLPWAWVGFDDIAATSSASQLRLDSAWTSGGRWFAHLLGEPVAEPSPLEVAARTGGPIGAAVA